MYYYVYVILHGYSGYGGAKLNLYLGLAPHPFTMDTHEVMK